MKTKNLFLSSALAAVLVAGGVVLAQEPRPDIDPAKHSNLFNAQKHIHEAFEALEVAQKENRDQLGGHAAKAESLLAEANREVKEAAEFADHHK